VQGGECDGRGSSRKRWRNEQSGRLCVVPPDGGRASAGAAAVRVLRAGSTEDWQDPVTSKARQREQAEALVRGCGQIVAELFDVGQSRAVAWARRPQSAALVAQLADPDRDRDAVVIGEYERAFYGSQYAAMALLFEHSTSSAAGPGCPAGRPRTCSRPRPVGRHCTSCAIRRSSRCRGPSQHAHAGGQVRSHVGGVAGQVRAAVCRGLGRVAGAERSGATSVMIALNMLGTTNLAWWPDRAQCPIPLLTCGGPEPMRQAESSCLTESGPDRLEARRCLTESGP
jgi:hypothetical protein